jgi:hypothetical protein
MKTNLIDLGLISNGKQSFMVLVPWKYSGLSYHLQNTGFSYRKKYVHQNEPFFATEIQHKKKNNKF